MRTRSERMWEGSPDGGQINLQLLQHLPSRVETTEFLTS